MTIDSYFPAATVYERPVADGDASCRSAIRPVPAGRPASKIGEFRSRYPKELDDKDDVVQKLVEEANGRTLTLLFAAHDRSCSHAVVLLDDLIGKRQGLTDAAN